MLKNAQLQIYNVWLFYMAVFFEQSRILKLDKYEQYRQ